MNALRLSKHHGLGNDFLVALEARNPGLRAEPAWAPMLCDRYRGIGADGLIFGLKPSDKSANAEMVLVNSDGSVAEISGNGIRCLAQAIGRDRARRGGPVVIDTAAGRREITVSATDDPFTELVRVDMGPVGPGPSVDGAAALLEGLDPIHIGTGEVGNPHLVIHLDDTDGVTLHELGSSLEGSFPDGINVHFLNTIGDDTIRLRIWERGAGATQACGSGATVAATLAHRWGLTGPTVEVQMEGGTATIEVDGDRSILTGPATVIADIEVPEPGGASG